MSVLLPFHLGIAYALTFDQAVLVGHDVLAGLQSLAIIISAAAAIYSYRSHRTTQRLEQLHLDHVLGPVEEPPQPEPPARD